MQKIVTSLWFDTQAEEAATYYCSLFPDSKILAISRYGSAGPREEGLVMSVDFELAGTAFNAINGGPEFKFSEATSLLVNCEDLAEVDRLWEALGDGGEPGPCGWIRDRFGLSWQVVPTVLGELASDPNPVKAQAVIGAMLQMGKLDVAELQRAYDEAA